MIKILNITIGVSPARENTEEKELNKIIESEEIKEKDIISIFSDSFILGNGYTQFRYKIYYKSKTA